MGGIRSFSPLLHSFHLCLNVGQGLGPDLEFGGLSSCSGICLPYFSVGFREQQPRFVVPFGAMRSVQTKLLFSPELSPLAETLVVNRHDFRLVGNTVFGGLPLFPCLYITLFKDPGECVTRFPWKCIFSIDYTPDERALPRAIDV